MKFGGSSVANADRMREVAAIMCSFPEQYPCIVLSAMGKVRVLCIGLTRVTYASPDASCSAMHKPDLRCKLSAQVACIAVCRPLTYC